MKALQCSDLNINGQCRNKSVVTLANGLDHRQLADKLNKRLLFEGFN